MQHVMVLRSAVTNQRSRIYHTENCHHLENAIRLVDRITLSQAERMGLSLCLHCHRARTRDWACGHCGAYLLIKADPKNTGQAMMVCPNGHLTAEQKPRQKVTISIVD